MKRTSKVTTAKEFNHKTYELDPDASDQGIELEARPMPHSWTVFHHDFYDRESAEP